MAGNAIRMGGAFVEIFTDWSKMKSGLRAAEQFGQSWGSKIKSAGTSILGSGPSALVGNYLANATAASLGMAGMVQVFANAGSELVDMSNRTGASVESLSALQFAAKMTGTEFSAIETGAKKLQNNISDAAAGNEEAVKTFDKWGLSAQSFIGLPLEQQLGMIADKMATLGAEDRTAFAMDLLGKSGTQLIGILGNGSAGLLGFTDRAKELGIVMSSDTAARADMLGDRIDEVKAVAWSTAFAFGDALMPAVMGVSEIVIEAIQSVRDFTAANPGLVQSVAMVTAGLAAGGAAAITLGVAASLVATTLGTVGSVAVLAGIGVGAVLGDMTDLFSWVGTAWGGVVSAIGSGDLGLAGDIAMASLNVAWAIGIGKVKDGWTSTTFWLSEVWINTVAGIETAWVNASTIIGTAWNSAVSVLDSSMTELSVFIVDLERAAGLISKGDAAQQRSDLRGGRDSRKKQRQDSVASWNTDAEDKRLGTLAELEAQRQAEFAKTQQAVDDARGELETKSAQAADQLASKADTRNQLGRKGRAIETREQEESKKHKEKSERAGDVTLSGLVSSLNRGWGGMIGEMKTVEAGASLGKGQLQKQTPEQIAAETAAAQAMVDKYNQSGLAGQLTSTGLQSQSTSTASADTEAQSGLLGEIRDVLRSIDTRVASGGTMTA